MHRYTGTILSVNLATETIHREPLAEEFIQNFTGAQGFSSNTFYDTLNPGIDPMGLDNEIIIGTSS